MKNESDTKTRNPVTDGSVARVMWTVCIAEPVTSKEVAHILDIERHLARKQLLRLYRSALVERKRAKNSKQGGNPYLYIVNRPPPEHK